MEITDYATQNVWWKGKAHINEDRHINSYLAKKYRWHFPILDEIKLNPGNIFTIRGPRQIGKTTLIKLIIKSLIEEDANEKAIFYATCDVIIDHIELLELVRGYLEFADFNNVREKFIFLDEISGIENWQKAIKLLVDSGELDDTCLILTGSHTLDIKYGFERLPGRTGRHGTDYLLLPLTFGEFVSLVRHDITASIRPAASLSIAAINEAVNRAVPFDRELKVLFNQYLAAGGFPLAINEFYEENAIPDYIYELYTRWVVGDITKWGRQEKILKQIVRTAIRKQGTAISWDSFARSAAIKSHKTVSVYAEDLENMFVFFVLYQIDLHKKAPNYNKNKKVYFFDPFIFSMFNRMFYFKDAEITPALIESVAVVHFARFAQRRVPYAKLNDITFYWKNKKETDIVLLTEDELFAVEVKYQERITKDDFASLYHFKEGVIASKSSIKLDEPYSVVPVHILLAVI
ncbi:MAG: ATP-binding protein [Methanosarcinales archaeon]|nr:ATP-binding protein [Methanosarcinales archaeon]